MNYVIKRGDGLACGTVVPLNVFHVRLKWFFIVDSGLKLISVDLCRSAISIQLNAIKMTWIEWHFY